MNTSKGHPILSLSTHKWHAGLHCSTHSPPRAKPMCPNPTGQSCLEDCILSHPVKHQPRLDPVPNCRTQNCQKKQGNMLGEEWFLDRNPNAPVRWNTISPSQQVSEKIARDRCWPGCAEKGIALLVECKYEQLSGQKVWSVLKN